MEVSNTIRITFDPINVDEVIRASSKITRLKFTGFTEYKRDLFKKCVTVHLIRNSDGEEN